MILFNVYVCIGLHGNDQIIKLRKLLRYFMIMYSKKHPCSLEEKSLHASGKSLPALSAPCQLCPAKWDAFIPSHTSNPTILPSFKEENFQIKKDYSLLAVEIVLWDRMCWQCMALFSPMDAGNSLSINGSWTSQK